MKKSALVLTLCLAISLSLIAKHSLAAAPSYFEFKPSTAQLVPPNKVNTKTKIVEPKTQAIKTQTNNTVSEAYIRFITTDTVNHLLAQGLLKGENGDKGDASGGVLGATTFNPDAIGFQQVYIPGAVIGPDVGTFFAATNLSSDNITSASANLGDIESGGNLTVAGDADLQGNITLATTTVGSINVGTLTSDSGAFLSDGGVWTNASSRELKENFASVSPETILDKINGLPIYQWNYKKEDASIMHIGPTSEDFFGAFGLSGEKGKTSISTIDPAGVALSGIQALNHKLNSLLDFSWILDGLKKLGIEIGDGFIKTKQFVADLVQTKELEVGSPDHPTGITIYDRATGEPICMFSENKVMKMETGKCSELAQNNNQPENTTQPIPDPDPSPAAVDLTDASTTPDSILPPSDQTTATTTDISMQENQSAETTQN